MLLKRGITARTATCFAEMDLAELDALEDLREAVRTSSHLRQDECRALLRGFHATGARSLDVALELHADREGGTARAKLQLEGLPNGCSCDHADRLMRCLVLRPCCFQVMRTNAKAGAKVDITHNACSSASFSADVSADSSASLAVQSSSKAAPAGPSSDIATLEWQLRQTCSQWDQLLAAMHRLLARRLQRAGGKRGAGGVKEPLALHHMQSRFEQDLRNRMIAFKRRVPWATFETWLSSPSCPFHENLKEFEAWNVGDVSGAGTHGWAEYKQIFDTASASDPLLDPGLEQIAADHAAMADAEVHWDKYMHDELFKMAPMTEAEGALASIAVAERMQCACACTCTCGKTVRAQARAQEQAQTPAQAQSEDNNSHCATTSVKSVIEIGVDVSPDSSDCNSNQQGTAIAI